MIHTWCFVFTFSRKIISRILRMSCLCNCGFLSGKNGPTHQPRHIYTAPSCSLIFAAMVLDAKVAEVENTVAISTLMYAPQLAWFPDNGSVPYPGYSNQREKIDWLNSAINQENRRNNAPEFPGFHTYGVRKATRKYTDWYGQVHHRAIKAHRWEHWRESEPASMLHLRNDRRIKMAMALNKYLIFNTDCS